jgi:hypothetical protein
MEPKPRADDRRETESGFDPDATTPEGPRRPRRPRISRRMRVVFFAAGWLLVAIGVAGLVLPGIQGVVTIVVGLALLSVVSRTAHGGIRRALARWPGLRRRVERLRWRLRRRFARRRGEPGA